jgi:circadian clock protein KaiC
MHLLAIHEAVRDFQPRLMVIDPITNLISVGDPLEVRSMLTRLIDFLKHEQITTIFTSLTPAAETSDKSEAGVSSLIDTWISLRNVENAGERNRALHVLKSRGMAHSNQVREFQLTSAGIKLVAVSVSGGDVLVGSARFAHDVQTAAEASKRKEELERLRRAVENKRRAASARISALQAESEAELDELNRRIAEESTRISALSNASEAMLRRRMDGNAHSGGALSEPGPQRGPRPPRRNASDGSAKQQTQVEP